MNCESCNNAIYASAMSVTTCKGCGRKLLTGHVPGHQYCKECAAKAHICEQCGSQLLVELEYYCPNCGNKWDYFSDLPKACDCGEGLFIEKVLCKMKAK